MPESETATDTSPTSDERNWALAAHAGPLVATAVTGPLYVFVPLIIWQIKKDESEFVSDQGKESLNFQITMFMTYAICLVLVFAVIGIFLLALAGLAHLIFGIIATIKAGSGERYRYPFAIRLVT